MHREIDVALVSLSPDALDAWADLLRTHFPRLQWGGQAVVSERLIDVVETFAHLHESGELELLTETESGDRISLRVSGRDWSWR